MSNVFENVQFEFNAGVTDEQGLSAVKASMDFAKEQDGFIKRSLTKNNDGLWVDVIEWKNMNSAKAAGGKFMEDKRNAEFGSLINGPTVKMLHLDCMLAS